MKNTVKQYIPLERIRSSMQTKMSLMINAPQQEVINIYRDYNNWNKLFPATIKNAHLLKEKDGMQTVEVDHRKAGKVINILRFPSENEIELEEFKPLYNAIFLNRFESIAGGTVYIIEAFIFLKGIYKMATPFIKGLVRKRINNYVLKPMKEFAENKNPAPVF
jgi:hypothetical protein